MTDYRDRHAIAGLIRREICRENWISWGDALAAADVLLSAYEVSAKPEFDDARTRGIPWTGRPVLRIVPDEVR